MHRFRRLLALERSISWLLCLALLLPVAQAAAAWHAYSHLDPTTSGSGDGKRPSDAAHCDLCLTAAGLAGGALVEADTSPLPAADHHALPREVVRSVWLALVAPAYLSRAPPLARP